MNDNNIEEFLRSSRPVIKDDPTFILETRQRLEAIEEIKEEVDRQRRHGRTVVLAALFLGLLAGILITAIAFLFPEETIMLKEGLRKSLNTIPDDWKILLVSLAILAITLAPVLFQGRKGRNRLFQTSIGE